MPPHSTNVIARSRQATWQSNCTRLPRFARNDKRWSARNDKTELHYNEVPPHSLTVIVRRPITLSVIARSRQATWQSLGTRLFAALAAHPSGPPRYASRLVGPAGLGALRYARNDKGGKVILSATNFREEERERALLLRLHTHQSVSFCPLHRSYQRPGTASGRASARAQPGICEQISLREACVVRGDQ